MNHEELVAKVVAYNRAATIAKNVQKELQAIFSEYIGRKVNKVDGSLYKEIQDKLPKYNDIPNVQVYKYHSIYNLVWVVRCWEQVKGKESCIYHEMSVYIGELSYGGILTKLHPKIDCAGYYTVEQVEMLIVQRDNAQRALDEANSALGPFRY